ncbi:hypothetical protein QBC46DRAFT_390698 [Diplogelasinospora grovesii]|uniref:Uncharacterized protein n=1 Tax=Diplogelasinospora grovesii TaxID=303347 RepID=A0AAN6N4F9_9PEZI|nr:hypothetical protein QBC46DRAFT_390698 [Diplogelasinospora grovesii]
MPTETSQHAGPKSTGGMASATTTPANAHLGQDKPKAFDSSGAIGKQFTENGALGGMAQKIGGPMDKEGMIGKQFTDQGSIGGTVQNMMGGKSKGSN